MEWKHEADREEAQAREDRERQAAAEAAEAAEIAAAAAQHARLGAEPDVPTEAKPAPPSSHPPLESPWHETQHEPVASTTSGVKRSAPVEENAEASPSQKQAACQHR